MKSYKLKTTKITILFVCILAVLFSSSIRAQTTINASGGSENLAGAIHQYSIGEMMVVDTHSNGNITVTQGLLQIGSDYLDVSEEIFSSQNLTIYPNPVKNVLYLEPILEGSGELSVQLFDLQGRRIMQQKFFLQTGLEKQELDLSTLSEATYMLNVKFNKGQKNYRQTYKVVKTSGR
ncbi:T9SS type A sorting domain-containing protein [Haloflavibacter putidus]|uniref:T9SS type A sorting domain-containing protein n=1 Tax=Haloflavibacter putidus TaxID=2576776 RepID=A0A507ZSD0_9FLAO|nr:T9SS type A sorting domain-containing protein [Haloflavibacter putidus]TQD40279.1 T9SS type A sorting domain-containing protein [Haloflavibacter putidus]